MFDPSSVAEKKRIDASKRKARVEIEGWVRAWCGEEGLDNLESVMVSEIACGDPNCSPVDTLIKIHFTNDRQPLQGSVNKPLHEVTQDDTLESCSDMLRTDYSPAVVRAGTTIMQFIMNEAEKLPSMDEQIKLCDFLMDNIDTVPQIIMQRKVRQLRGRPQAQAPENAMLSAAQKNNVQRLADLIAGGMDPNWGNSVGQTALHVAVLWGNADAADLLISRGANVNKPNELTRGTPLHILCSSSKELGGRLRCAGLLLDAGADVHKTDGQGESPLDIARQAAQMEPSQKPLYELLQECASAAEGDTAIGR